MESYDTPVTLRQLFYRLVSDKTLKNSVSDYNDLGHRTADPRRDGTFPHFAEAGRPIYQRPSWSGPEAAKAALRAQYRIDRQRGQELYLYLLVEKAGMVEQLRSWFGDDLGIPVIACEGRPSVTLEERLRSHITVNTRTRIPIGIYAGDCDATGIQIDRDFALNLPELTFERIALSEAQVDQYDLPRLPGKPKDPNAAAFIREHGSLWQVELDALDPDVLRALYQEAIDQYWDSDAYEAALAQEERDREALR